MDNLLASPYLIGAVALGFVVAAILVQMWMDDDV